MTGEVERWHQPADREVRHALAYFKGAPSVLGEAFKDPKTGVIDWGAVALAAATCLDCGLAPIPNIHKMPVIKGQVFPEAEVCRTLAIRAGWIIDLVEDTPEVCTVQLSKGDRRPPAFSVTMAEMRLTAAGKTNSLYRDDPRAMLRARATRRAIVLYCPEVLAGPPGRFGDEDDGEDDEDGSAGPVGAVGEAPVLPGPESSSRMVPARSVAPSGATIPEHLREPEVADAVRTQLLERIACLDEETTAELRAVCQHLGLPNVRTARFTRAHGALLDRLIDETAENALTRANDPGPATATPTVPGETLPPASMPAGPGPTPHHVHDDAPEARGYDPDLQPASYDDPGRPF